MGSIDHLMALLQTKKSIDGEFCFSLSEVDDKQSHFN